MKNQTPVGFNALAWVKHEIDQSLDQARWEISAYAENPDHTQHLARTLSLLRDVQGTLDVAELEGAALLANESLEVVKALSEGSVSNVEEACKQVIRALIQLPDYLDYVQSGQEDTPLVLVSVINDLRAVRKAEFVSEGVGAIRGLDNDAAVLDGQVRSGEDLQSIAELTRLVFELGLLGWYRNTNVQESLGKMSLVCRRLRLASTHRASRRLWWTAEALTEALQSGRLQSSDAVKTLLGRVDREIKRLFKVGEAAFSATISLDLVKSLLYYIAISKPGNKVVDEVRKAYFLDQDVPDPDALEGYQKSLSGNNRALKRSVAMSLSEDIDEIKDHLERFDRSVTPSLEDLGVLLSLFSRLEETLGALDSESAQLKVSKIRAMMAEKHDEGVLPNAEELEAIAQSLIEAEHAIGEFGVGRGASQQQAGSGRSSDEHFLNVRSVAIKEILSDINQCKNQIQRYANGQSGLADLDRALPSFSSIHGALHLLSLDQAADLVRGIQDYLGQKIEDGSELEATQLDYLAETIAAVEVFLEVLDNTQIEQPDFIETGFASLNVLRAVQAEPAETGERTALLPEMTLEREIPDQLTLETGFVDPLTLSDSTDLSLEPVTEAVTETAPVEEISLDEPAEIDLAEASAQTTALEVPQVEDENGGVDTGDHTDEPLEQSGTVGATSVLDAIEAQSMEIPDVGDLPEFEPLTELPTLSDATELDTEARDATTLDESLVEMQALDDEVLAAFDDGETRYGQDSELVDLHELASTLSDSDGAVTDFEFDESLIASLQDPALTTFEDQEAEVPSAREKPAETEGGEITASDTSSSQSPATSLMGLDIIGKDTDDEIFGIFVEELAEETEVLQQQLPRWADDPADETALVQARRAFHTIKGSGRLIGAQVIGEFAWIHEQILNQVIDKTLEPVPEVVACVQQGASLLPELGRQLEQRTQPDESIHRHAAWAQRVAAGQLDENWRAEPLQATETHDTTDGETAEAESGTIGLMVENLPTLSAIDASEMDISMKALDESLAHEPELMEIFVADARRNLAIIQGALPAADEVEAWRPGESLRIAAHTLNGSARTAGVEEIARPFKACESYLRLKNERDLALDRKDTEAMAALVEHTEQVLDAIDQQHERPSGNDLADRFQDLIAALDATQEVEPEEDATAEVAATAAGITAPEVVEQAESEQLDSESVETTATESEKPETEAQSSETSALTFEGAPATGDEGAAETGEQSVATGITDQQAVADGVKLESLELPGVKSAEGPAATQVTELVEVFLDECHEILETCDEAMVRWQKDRNDLEPVDEIKRELHTLKGSARMAGIEEIGSLSHAMETLLADISAGKVTTGKDTFSVVLGAFDKISQMADDIRQGESLAPIQPVLNLMDKVRSGATLEERDFQMLAESEQESLQQVPEPEAPSTVPAASEDNADVAEEPVPAETETPPAEPVMDELKGELDLPGAQETPLEESAPRLQEAIRIQADLLDRLVDNIGEVNVFHSRIEQQVGSFDFNIKELDQTIRRVTEQLRRLELEAEAQILHRNKGMPINPDDSQVGKQFDPLELDRYSKLQQLSRSLAESTADLKNIHQLLADEVGSLEKILQQQARVSNELQEGLMRTRMSKFKVMAPRLRRVVRRTAMELGKEVELRIEGENNELDRKMLESIVAPLEHLLRNAVAHGIETPEARRAAGKPEQGVATVTIRREGPQIIITVADDGAGIDPQRVRQRAIEAGLIHEHDDLTPEEINKLILRAGFSTADEVSQIAGRGVGMDVVATHLKQLNGVMEIQSEPGKGAEFRISIPFTLAINQALLITANKGKYAIPMGSIDGVIQLPGKSLAEKLAQDEPRLAYAGREYAIRSLASVLEKSAPGAINESHVYPVLLGRSGGHQIAFVADEILGNREIVVKPVGAPLSSLESISGATILGDGQIVLILDIAGLVRLTQEDRDYVEPVPAEEEDRQPLVMVVDDSITIRKVTSRMLERHNFAVVTAKDGLDAVAQLQEVHPDIMLLDIEMPRMDGFELAEHVRNSEQTRDLPIIMISSRTGRKHRERAKELGVNRFLGKPYQDQELLETINALMEGESHGTEQFTH